MIYRRIASARTEEEIGRIVDEARDRYGPPPTAVLNLADFGRIRVLADDLGIDTVDRDGSFVVFKFGSRTKVDPMHILALVKEREDLLLLPPNTIKLDIRNAPGGKTEPSGGISKLPPGGAKNLSGKRAIRKPSWWVARATAGEVKPGFTKAEMLKAAPEDPRAPDGVLAKVTELLEELRA
jgi:transcription-repair coupling factor (superfamily II helicase)